MRQNFDEWRLPRTCPCWHCRGGKNKHAWSFYYFLKRRDLVRVWVVGDEIVIRKFA